MTGELTIDTIDIWTTYGAFLLKGGYNELMRPSKRKASLSNSWPEQDGIEVDLSAPKFEDKDVDLSFILSASSEAEWWTRYNAFFALLKGAGTRSMYVKELNKTILLYYKEAPSYEQLTKIKGTSTVAARFTIKFCVPSPAF
jgi:hypothetical protein